MRDLVISMPHPHETQLQFLRGCKRFNVLCAGRRWGKNVVMHRRCIHPLLRGQPVAWFAPTYRMMVDDWEQITDRLAPMISRKTESGHRTELVSGGVLEMWSLDNPDSVRGRKYAHVIINEAAMVANLADIWSMIIRPTLADLRGSADFGSTPRGLNGFHALYQAAPDHEDWARFHYRTEDNPHMPADELVAMREALPERVVRQELDAEFVEDGSYFQGIDRAATVAERSTPADHVGHYLVMGVDWGMSGDFTVLTVFCRDCGCVVAWERFNQIDFTYQRDRLVRLADTWKCGVLPERNSIGEPNIEMLRGQVSILSGPDRRPGFMTTAATKPALIQELAAGIENGAVRYPPEYSDELKTYEVEMSVSGHAKFSAPSGAHDDRVISLALAWWAARRPKPATMIDFT